MYSPILLDSLTLPGAAAASARLAPLTEQDWGELINQARLHGVEPLLWQRLTELGLTGALPASAQAQLQRRVLFHNVHNLGLYHELSQALAALAAAAIPVIVLKGAYLAKTVYSHPGLRPMLDIDLLVKRADLERAQTVLLGLGYRQEQQRPIEEVCQECAELDVFWRPNGAAIDLHWHIEKPTAPFTIDLDEIWARAQPWRLQGQPASVLAPEDLLLQLGLHSAYHHSCGIGLYALFDIARVIERYQGQLDWSVVATRARQWRANRPVGLALMLARDLVGAAAPASLLRELDPDNHTTHWLPVAKSEILTDRRDPPLARPPTDQDRVDGFVAMLSHRHMDSKRTRTAKVGLVLGRLFPPKQILRARYPTLADSPLLYGLYLVHWLRQIGHYGLLLATRRHEWRDRRRLHRWLQATGEKTAE